MARGKVRTGLSFPLMQRTFAEAFRDTAPRSFWFESLRKRAGSVPLVDWLVGQLNARGYRGTDFLYDPTRLLRKRGGERPWQRKQS